MIVYSLFVVDGHIELFFFFYAFLGGINNSTLILCTNVDMKTNDYSYLSKLCLLPVRARYGIIII